MSCCPGVAELGVFPSLSCSFSGFHQERSVCLSGHELCSPLAWGGSLAVGSVLLLWLLLSLPSQEGGGGSVPGGGKAACLSSARPKYSPNLLGREAEGWPAALQEFLLSTLLWHMGHGSPEQNFCVPTETAPTEHFCTEICILQAAGEALQLFWEKGPFLNTEGKLDGVSVGQGLISSSPHCV